MSSFGLTFSYSMGSESGPDVLSTVAGGFERAGVEMGKWGSYLFPHLIPAFERAIGEQFSAEGEGPGAGHWARLSESYAKVKARRWPGQPILVASGKLKAALTISGADGALRETTATSLAFGTRSVEYASYHQMGTSNKDGSPKMPARPEVDFTNKGVELMQEAAAAALRELVAVSRLDALLEGDLKADLRDWEGPLTKGQAAAAKGRKTRITKLKATKARREGK